MLIYKRGVSTPKVIPVPSVGQKKDPNALERVGAGMHIEVCFTRE